MTYDEQFNAATQDETLWAGYEDWSDEQDRVRYLDETPARDEDALAGWELDEHGEVVEDLDARADYLEHAWSHG